MRLKHKFSLIFLLLAVSCSLKETAVGEFEFNVCLGPEEDGRVALGEKSGSTYPLVWCEGDRISVNGVASSPLTAAAAGARSAGFSFASSLSSPYYVVYPAASFVTPKRMSFPSEQIHAPGSCPASSMVLARRTGSASGIELCNMCGCIRFNIPRGEDLTPYTKMVFKGNAGEFVAGVFNINFDSSGIPSIGTAYSGESSITLTDLQETGEYIICVPAMTFASGFSFTVYDESGHFMRLRTGSSVTVGPGVLINAPSAVYEANGTLLDAEVGDAEEDENPIACYIHTVREMNREPAVINSHAGEELESVLQPVWDSYQVLDNLWLLNGLNIDVFTDQRCAIYPRIKYLPDGSFLMFYMGGHYGSRIWVTRSTDFKNWSTPVRLFKPRSVTVDGVECTRRYVNPDAVVLPNGDVLMVASFRSAGVHEQNKGSGLVFMRSSDGGLTWGSPYELEASGYVIWEPYLLLLPDGTLQCFFTDAITFTRNSGTGMVSSTDGGYTWSSKIRTCQQYKYDYYTTNPEKSKYNGQKIYTDQMPCLRVLNDGKTIVGLFEGRYETPTPSDCADNDTYNSSCRMSLIRNHSLSWTDLTSYNVVNEGPADRTEVVERLSYSPYVATFPSGETVFSWTGGHRKGKNGLKVRLITGDATATHFRGDDWGSCSGSTFNPGPGVYTPFEHTCMWQGIETFAQNFLAVGAMVETIPDADTLGIQIGLMYLNHRINAPSANVKVNGVLDEWSGTRALFVSAPSGEEAVLRASHDDTNLYLALETVDHHSKARVKLMLASGNTVKLSLEAERKSLKKLSGTVSSSARANGFTDVGKQGWLHEIAVPLSSLGVSAGGDLRCYMDIKVDGQTTPFTFATESDTKNWQRIRLE